MGGVKDTCLCTQSDGHLGGPSTHSSGSRKFSHIILWTALSSFFLFFPTEMGYSAVRLLILSFLLSLPISAFRLIFPSSSTVFHPPTELFISAIVFFITKNSFLVGCSPHFFFFFFLIEQWSACSVLLLHTLPWPASGCWGLYLPNHFHMSLFTAPT